MITINESEYLVRLDEWFEEIYRYTALSIGEVMAIIN